MNMINATKARFVVPTSVNEGRILKVGELMFTYASFDEQTEEMLRNQAERWVIKDYHSYTYENDDYGTSSSDSSIIKTPLNDMTSISSGCYSSNDVLGDILVIDNEVAGAILYITEEGGNGWSNYNRKEYSLLYTDGKTVGKTTKSYSFSGESSSRYIYDSYSLVEREPEEK